MLDKLAQLYRYLYKKDKSAALSVARQMRKISTGPFDAPQNWELYPEDAEGSWDSKKYFDEELEGLQTEEFELPETPVTQAIRNYINSAHPELGEYTIKRIIPLPPEEDSDDRDAWRVITEYKANQPIDIPEVSVVEWDIWEVYPGEYGFNNSVEIPGTDRRIYGES